MGKFAPGTNLGDSFPTRIRTKIETPDVDPDANTNYILRALHMLHNNLTGLAERAADFTRPVDEYSTGSEYLTTGQESVTSVEVLPTYDTMPERITSILITGPVNTAFNAQVGDRQWFLATDARGLCVIAPVSMLLNRNDRRLLNSVTAGAWTMELMGWADKRFP